MKKLLPDLIAILAFIILSFAYFFPADIEGRILFQHDSVAGVGAGQESKEYRDRTGERTRWTNAIFGGMPTYQMSPSYDSTKPLNWVEKVYRLYLPDYVVLTFIMMLGFYILLRAFGISAWLAALGGVIWAFSSYFFILISAGHIWKFVTLAYIPPTIAGVVLAYRKKYLLGGIITALFIALQIQSNHIQMSYYFMFVILFIVGAYFEDAYKKKELPHFFKASAVLALAAVVGVCINISNLYHTYEYSKETMRGKSELKQEGSAANQTSSGLDRDYITNWSYGIGETLTLLVPNVKGGASSATMSQSEAAMAKANPMYGSIYSQFPQYFGDQPMTNGPVYVGAFVLLLAILALFTVDTPMKWALFAVSLLAILLSWGHNFAPLTDFFIDRFPGYNKFRAVASILVIVEFAVPLLAALCLKNMMDTPERYTRNPWTVYTVFGAGALICLAGWIWPGIFGSPFSETEISQLTEAGAFANPAYYGVIDAIRETRLSLVRADAVRSLVFILLGSATVWLWFSGKIRNRALFVGLLTVIALADLYTVGKRYVNTENFTAPVENEATLKMTAADEAILRDKSNYRVLDVAGMSSARSSYFHKTIGGYHAAKLTRYNDLLEHQIAKGNPGVINMLNAKYILNGEEYQQNPDALGNAWWAQRLDYVPDADAEMAALDTLDTSHGAVADAGFRATLGTAVASAPGDTIYETSYAPNRLDYKARSARGGVAVFSEIYFPWGWKATIDGKEAPIGRVNYVLRALRIPAGEHEVTFTFDPGSLKVTNALGVSSVIVIYVLCAAALALCVYAIAGKRKKD